MTAESTPPSAWRPLIDEWVAREGQLRPHLPVLGDSVRVRDAVEVGDQAYVLLSYDVDSPWPKEEDVAGAGAAEHTAVIQAERVRQPWHERDSTRSRTAWRTSDGTVTVHEHLLGPKRAFSGQVLGADAGTVTISFDAGDAVEATVVDGWFLAVVPEGRRVQKVSVDGAESSDLEPADMAALLPDPTFARSGADAMYFSPLDLRTVHSLVQWQRVEDVVVVATCLEQYDEGGMLRLRIDGIRADDDTFVAWPRVTLFVDGNELPSAVCGEYSLADTISLDIGLRPWLPAGASQLQVQVAGIRGAAGEIEPVVLDVKLPPRA